MLISYFLDSVVYCLVNRCRMPLIITSMILLLRKFHPRGEESSVMNYFIAFCANRKWSNLFDITHCVYVKVLRRIQFEILNYLWRLLVDAVYVKFHILNAHWTKLRKCRIINKKSISNWWGSAFKYRLHKVEILQKKAIRNTCNTVYNAPTAPLFKQLGIAKLIDVYNIQLCKLMYSYTPGTLLTPLKTIFTSNSAVHTYETRHAADPHVAVRKTSIAARTFIHQCPRVWLVCQSI